MGRFGKVPERGGQRSGRAGRTHPRRVALQIVAKLASDGAHWPLTRRLLKAHRRKCAFAAPPTRPTWPHDVLQRSGRSLLRVEGGMEASERDVSGRHGRLQWAESMKK